MFRTVPFPLLPEWLPIAPQDRPVAMRAFGSDLRDMALEFDGVERARLVTNLLARCAETSAGSPAAEQTIWELPIGTRIEAVLRLAADDSARPLAWRVCCWHCGAEGELELRAAEVEEFAAAAYRQNPVPVRIGDKTAWLRRPTGADQLLWLSADPQTAPIAAGLFVEPAFEDLRAAGVPIDDIGDSIDRAMEEFDPLIGFHVEVGCQECGRSTKHAPDLLDAALDRLWRGQFALVDQVHLLASHYHWTEEDIAKIPAWRRNAYLARIGGGEL
jgi:hypothetical protein